MKTETHYSLAELARVTGVTPRTVRYYIVQGLLPGANDTGPSAWYEERHLSRLRLVRELQRQHLPLAEIRARLAGLADDEVLELIEAQASKPAASDGSALDYVRALLGTARRDAPSPRVLRAYEVEPGTVFSVATPPSATPKEPAPTAERSQWDRIALTNDIELHVRRPLSRLDNRRVERLITIARQVLGEEQP